jgi:uncharacterized protein YjbI with pentapeptide repeats
MPGIGGGLNIVIHGSDLSEADLRGADLNWAGLFEADLSGADLRKANLRGAMLAWAGLYQADLRGADLQGASLVETDFSGANLTDCSIFGISAWALKLEGATQLNLLITPQEESDITVDNLEIAQFIYLFLTTEKSAK